MDERLRFNGRNRRPPRDCFNALLSFGYALLYRDVMQAILAVGLEPSFGFYHTPRSASHPLALDLMELFRVSLWDIAVVASVNRLQWSPDDDFTIADKQVWLNDKGRKRAIEVYERRKEDQWKHPVTGYSLSYARLIELECRLLEKEWTGEPGLFARFECRMTRRELERMRWELEKELSEEDSLMIAGLCAGCHSKVIARNTRNEYLKEQSNLESLVQLD